MNIPAEGMSSPGSAEPTPELLAERTRLRSGNLVEALLSGADEPAIEIGERRLSYRDLRSRVEEVAAGLYSLGLRPGLRLSLFGANSLEWVLVYLAAIRVGAIVNPVNPAYRQTELRHIGQDAEPSFLVADAERVPLVAEMRAELPSVKHLVELERLPVNGRLCPEPDLAPETPALLMYTSGTTGRPKGALLDHGNMLAQARGVAAAWRWTATDHLVHALPLFHVHGLGIALHGTMVTKASTVLVPFNPATVVDKLDNGASLFFGVPTMYHRLADYLEGTKRTATARLFVSGSAPLPPSLFERCVRLLNQPILERYGMTESGIAVANRYDGPRQPGRVGWPLPGVSMRVSVDSEVQLQGGQVFKGYWRNPSATHDVFTRDGWIRTGDVGEIDENGSLAIRGRLKEMIISGGLNIYPREVELVLEQHPCVADVAVVGIPSPEWGESVAACVVASQSVDPTELIAFTRDRLASYKCPRTIVLAPSVPRNAMGKVDRAAVSDLVQRALDPSGST